MHFGIFLNTSAINFAIGGWVSKHNLKAPHRQILQH